MMYLHITPYLTFLISAPKSLRFMHEQKVLKIQIETQYRVKIQTKNKTKQVVKLQKKLHLKHSRLLFVTHWLCVGCRRTVFLQNIQSSKAVCKYYDENLWVIVQSLRALWQNCLIKEFTVHKMQHSDFVERACNYMEEVSKSKYVLLLKFINMAPLKAI